MKDNEYKAVSKTTQPDLSEAYQQLQAKILHIYKLSGMTLDNIISHLAKGDVFTSPDHTNAHTTVTVEFSDEQLQRLINQYIESASFKVAQSEAIKEFKSKVENDIVILLGKSNCTEFIDCLEYRYKEMVGETDENA